MKTDFEFSNLLGTVYGRGNLLFTPDGTCLISPVGNRVTIFDLVNDKSTTLPFAHRTPISKLAIHSNGILLLSTDSTGQAILSHITRRIVLYHFTLRSPLTALQFSPQGSHFAAAFDRQIEVWHTPDTSNSSLQGGLEFAPFVKHRTYTGHYDEVTSLHWSSDSRFFLSTSKDLTARISSLNPEAEFASTTLSGHRASVLGAWFSKDQESIWTISKDGALFQWNFVDEKWSIANRHFFMQSPAHVTSAFFHPSSNLMFTAFSSGIFSILELKDFTELQSLSVSQIEIAHIITNLSGTWIAIASSQKSQLVVWDWQSESYILKQQSHHDNLNALAYTPDAQKIITCADDGKIKLWDTRSGFCSVTFSEHTAAVTACEFSKRGTVLFTASLDGSVRAWDVLRYRNFRTFTAPSRLGWSCLAVDPSGEVVAAGSHHVDVIHLWSVQTGQLLDQLAGHEGPVSSLAFTPDGTCLISGSWDNTIRIWNVFSRHQISETLQLQANVLALAIRPDSLQLAVSTLDGQLTFWNISDAAQVSVFDGRRDLSGGRRLNDRRTAASVTGTKSFTALTYSIDGICILAAGKSKYICLYEVNNGTLLKKFTVSVNLALDGTQEFLNSRSLTEAGPDLDETGEASDLEDRIEITLPGAQRGDASLRKYRPEVRVTAVAFSPSGRGFCAATTEGLLLYELDVGTRFDPFDLEVQVTPEAALISLKQGDFLQALVMGFRLNTASLLCQIFETIPISALSFVISSMPEIYLTRILRLVTQHAEKSPHLEFCLLWLRGIIACWGRVLKERKLDYAGEIRGLARVLIMLEREVRNIGESNCYAAQYLLSQPHDFEPNGLGKLEKPSSSEQVTKECDDDEWLGLNDE